MAIGERALLFDTRSAETRANPYPMYRRLRSEDPVHWSDPNDAWILTRYEDVVAVLRDPRMSSDGRNAERPGTFMQPEAGLLQAVMSQLMLFTDPPTHTRLRGLVQKAFTPKAIEAMRERIESVVSDLLDHVATNGELDLIADLALPLPVIVIAEILGVPPEDRLTFRQWAADLARTIDPVMTPEILERAVPSGLKFVQYFGDLIERRRKEPRDDLLSALVAAEEEGDRLSPQELVANCVLLLIAGHETTMNLIGNGMLALLRYPAQLQRLRGEPAMIKPAVEELLRYDSPVQMTARVALDGALIGGRSIKPRQTVVVMLGAANRDPDQFEEPDSLDVERRDQKHVAFGFGSHFCLGAPLARAEAQIAISKMVSRFPALALEDPEPEWRDTVTLRGLARLPLSTGEET